MKNIFAKSGDEILLIDHSRGVKRHFFSHFQSTTRICKK
jgi:hypothetical protein